MIKRKRQCIFFPLLLYNKNSTIDGKENFITTRNIIESVILEHFIKLGERYSFIRFTGKVCIDIKF